MAVYNDTFLNNATNFLEIAQGVGTSTGEPFLVGYITLMSFFLIFLAGSLRYDIKQVLMVDSFMCVIIATFLYGVSLLPPIAIIFPLVVLMFTMVAYYLTG